MRPVGYICNPCELITVDLLNEIEECRKKCQKVGIGIHSDLFFSQTFGRKPIKPFAEREKLIQALKGVDFTFELTAETDLRSEINISPVHTQTGYLKKYHVGYAPGTYDLFHEGHLEHLTEVKSLCDILVVGVNSDNLVFENKQKRTRLPQEERLKIVSNLSFVDYVYLVEDNNKSLANNWVKKNVGAPIDAIFVGTDLQNQDFHNLENIPILFTERDPVLMKMRCSTYYRDLLNSLQKK